jgi:hypothetical protein
MGEFGQPLGSDQFDMPSYLEGEEIWVPRVTIHQIGKGMHMMAREIDWRLINGGLGKMPQIN